MKIAISYPPLESNKGIPLLGQNRQFQWADSPWTAYPIVPAYTATMLQKAGHQVFWLDGINEGLKYKTWLKKLQQISPDMIILETKTPVVKKHWLIISDIKKISKKIVVVLVGDHVTALPFESFKNSLVDYVLTGGDYDFLSLNLVNHLTKKEKLEPGIYYRHGKRIFSTGKFKLNHNLSKLPLLDRDLTKWQLYAYKNSNYMRLPGTYTMFSRDCWWGKCTFCSWTTLYPGKCYRAIPVKKALTEVDHLINNYQIKEIMDDSGTFPVGKWLKDFCQGMIKKGFHKKIKININMRFNADLSQKDYLLMKKAGFRFLLFGLESSNQKTLDKLNKNLKIDQIEPVLKWAKKAGLNPHLTVMLGYPWETKKDIKNTLNYSKLLFKKGFIDSLQATIIIPYPGTPLFKEAKRKKLLKTLNWNKYDMKQAVLTTKIREKEIKSMIKNFYKSIFSLQFVLRKTKEALLNFDVFKYYLRFSFKYFSKLKDFKI
ncbi:B12-binding domain-containing radical SAM protein [Candidatus Beckwithbacteria bacterium CG10_big_fil_rev_8_21_14_0_10_34_10]|uniref:B12-binding domain-containing radical SAM protein n=1 Tax=Candidatus Beckwithbacteria bacterium CG10_big_fil_rev_8_21_14_0_10_34_10 TaxID=1974495 RepID=A0A2H0W811_9BACT|nr:MAG: B12-binding domain-containing radical SAM protein [Candidatus Beckwithbacteria bacterium CG10_big_fil_rev_8_21_14_0_10_34_10]